MDPALVEALMAQIEVAAVETQHAAVILCSILGPLMLVCAAMAVLSAIAAFADESDTPAFWVTSIFCGFLTFLLAVGFMCELSTALAPHAYIITHLIRTGS